MKEIQVVTWQDIMNGTVPPPQKVSTYTRKCYVCVGDYVYEAYLPQTPGVVKDIKKVLIKGTLEDYEVTVHFVNGTTKVVTDLILRDFNQLIADHQKKLNTHTSKLPLLAKL